MTAAIKAFCPMCGKEVELDEQRLIPVHAKDKTQELCQGSHARPIAKARRKK